jgi:hypothetical protein
MQYSEFGIEEDAEYEKRKEPFIGTKHEAQKWQVTNEYIMTGYRVGFKDNWLCFKSLIKIHNETGNVWTHLLGAFAFIWFGFYLFWYIGPP